MEHNVFITISAVSQDSTDTRIVPMCSQIRMCVQLDAASIGFSTTSKPVLSGHLNRKKQTILMTNVRLMKVESIA